MAEFTLLACPFCCGDNLELQNTHTPAFWITCDDCGAEMHGECIGDGPAEGPFSYSASPSGPFEATLDGLPPNYQEAALNAVEKWNRRDFSPISIATAMIATAVTQPPAEISGGMSRQAGLGDNHRDELGTAHSPSLSDTNLAHEGNEPGRAVKLNSEVSGGDHPDAPMRSGEETTDANDDPLPNLAVIEPCRTAPSHSTMRKIEFRLSVTGHDGCEIVLLHWPEGYALERHGEIVWREWVVPINES